MVSASFVELDNFWSALTCQRFGLWRLAATSAHLIDPTYGRDSSRPIKSADRSAHSKIHSR